MPDKKQMANLIEKWDWLLTDLSNAKYKLYKYGRIYENISKEKALNNLKILLPLAYRVFKKNPDINISRSGKQDHTIIELEKHDIDVMDIDAYMSLLDAISDMIIEVMNEKELSSLYKIDLEDINESYRIKIVC